MNEKTDMGLGGWPDGAGNPTNPPVSGQGRRRGRPKTRDARDVFITVRIKASDRDTLREEAENKRMRWSDYLRWCLGLGKP